MKTLFKIITPIFIVVGVLFVSLFYFTDFDYNILFKKQGEESVTWELNPPNINTSEEETLEAMGIRDSIKEDTYLVFRYYYDDDTVTEVNEIPPYFLIGMTASDIVDYFPDWQLISFSKEEVILQKKVLEKPLEKYIVGNHEGYVAVFYNDIERYDYVKEITDTPISSLSEEDQIRVSAGIFVTGESELIRLLEDFDS